MAIKPEIDKYLTMNDFGEIIDRLDDFEHSEIIEKLRVYTDKYRSYLTEVAFERYKNESANYKSRAKAYEMMLTNMNIDTKSDKYQLQFVEYQKKAWEQIKGEYEE